jgi:hypothetical protein
MNPYESLPAAAWWKSAMQSLPAGLCKPKQKITGSTRISTAGSCFAQHVTRETRRRGYPLYDAEAPPSLLQAERRAEFGYGLFSARYGNIYTAAQLHQLVQRAFNRMTPQVSLWQTDSRFYDPFRPTIEPNGFSSEAEAQADIASHLARVRSMLRKVDTFIFTLGLTEAWRSKADGSVYPLCPGAKKGIGVFDETKYEFVNYGFNGVMRDLTATFNFLRRMNPKLSFILTVSPVPLIATASGDHVLSATIYSKSVLRAAAGELAMCRPDVSYFRSYEMITSAPFGNKWFESDLRGIKAEGVKFVMDRFFEEYCEPLSRQPEHPRAPDHEQVVCDEEILASYR